MHRPAEDGTPAEAYWQTRLDLKAEGKVRAVGLSNHDVAQLDVAERLAIVYSPMQAGLLSGSFTAERAAGLPADDGRSPSPEFQGERLQRNLTFATALGPVAERHGVSVGAVGGPARPANPAPAGVRN